MHTSVPWLDWVPDWNVTSCWLDIDLAKFSWVLWTGMNEQTTTKSHILFFPLIRSAHPSLASRTCSHASQPHISRVVSYLYAMYVSHLIYKCEFNRCSVTRDLCYSTPATMPPLSSSPSRTSRTSIPPATCKPLQESCWFLLPTVLGLCSSSKPCQCVPWPTGSCVKIFHRAWPWPAECFFENHLCT